MLGDEFANDNREEHDSLIATHMTHMTSAESSNNKSSSDESSSDESSSAESSSDWVEPQRVPQDNPPVPKVIRKVTPVAQI